MSRLIYGLSGEGRGHTSRAVAVASQLRKRGHKVRFCCGGVAQTVLERRGEDVIPVPSLEYVLEGNQLQPWRTAWNIVPELARVRTTISRLCEVFATYDPALVIADFEIFSTRAAECLGIPVLSLNNQQIITESEYKIPSGEWLGASVARLATHLIAPWRPTHIIITSFYHLPLKNPDHATLVPPIIRSDVRNLESVKGDHVLVYYNHGEGAGTVLQSLKAVRQEAMIYGFPDDLVPERDPHLKNRPPSREGFLEDLAASRAVISTAGFTLMSEALYLGKPVLAVPNQGLFEQTLNACYLDRLGLGEQVNQENLDADFIREFLSRAERYRSQGSAQVDCGTEAAVDRIEEVLREGDPEVLSSEHALPSQTRNSSGG